MNDDEPYIHFFPKCCCLFTFRFLNFLDVAMDFEIVSTEDCGAVPNDLSGASRTEMYVKLEKDLLEQIKMCQANRIYFKSTGDVPSTNKFHQVKFRETSIFFFKKEKNLEVFIRIRSQSRPENLKKRLGQKKTRQIK